MSDINETAYGERESALKHFVDNRNKLEHLYKSERYHLQPALEQASNILDVGCAAGGGSQFSAEANSEIKYTGIDISDNFIELAKAHYPESQFASFDGHSIPFKDEHFDLCYSIGVCHHLVHWKEMIGEMLRVSSSEVIFDIRLTDKEGLYDPDRYFQKIAFDEEWDGVTKIPYIVLNIDEVKGYFELLASDLGLSIDVYGYAGKPTGLSVIPYDSVIMVSCRLRKNAAKSTVNFNIVDN